MSAVERAGYMDNIAAAAITETIAKEKKLQREYFKQQEALGKIKVVQDPQKQVSKQTLEAVGVPGYVTRQMADPVESMTLATSKSMWTSNPGYIVRDGSKLASVSQQDFVYNQEEIEFMKQQGYLNKTHNRRRDEFVMFVEAHAKQVNLMKGGIAKQS